MKGLITGGGFLMGLNIDYCLYMMFNCWYCLGGYSVHHFAKFHADRL